MREKRPGKRERENESVRERGKTLRDWKDGEAGDDVFEAGLKFWRWNDV